MTRFLRIVLAMCLVCSVAPAAEPPPLSHQLTPVDSGETAPALALPGFPPGINGLEALRGRVVVVNFWATWCPPCRREMPSLERLDRATADEEVVVLAVNVGEDRDAVAAFVATLDPPPGFPILLDEHLVTSGPWRVQGLPTTVVVAPDGRIAYRAIGGREFDHPDLVRVLLELHRAAQTR
ncbi:MAG: TlpA family protein disulfide reductase [Chromatiaceae bacterium]|nr:TlpA family protein disulfide reductase [Chromatiaceae bacterium]MCP5315287.1 TlpA family protein disulfide reductase [Chromatiaceae bacterium]